jgi:hypothetical protein
MNNAVRVGALFASAILFGFFLYLINVGADKGQYITVAVVFVFTVLATRLDDITNLTFGATGVQAALEKKLKEAEATVTQLQRVAELFGQISVLQISMSNRWDGLSSKEKREAIKKIETELRAINLSQERITTIIAPQRGYDRLDYFYWLTHGMPPNPTQQQLEGFTNFQQHFSDASLYNVPSIASVEDYMTKHDLMGGEMGEILKDWKQYERDGTHRRIDLWDHRHDLPK